MSISHIEGGPGAFTILKIALFLATYYVAAAPQCNVFTLSIVCQPLIVTKQVVNLVMQHISGAPAPTQAADMLMICKLQQICSCKWECLCMCVCVRIFLALTVSYANNCVSFCMRIGKRVGTHPS